MHLPDHVRIREVGPRDGFQSLKHVIPLHHKLEIIQAVIDAGVPEIEATSFANVKALPQFQDAPEVLAHTPRGQVVLSAMVFNEKTAQQAMIAGAQRIVTVVSASDAHNQANIRCNIDTSLSRLEAIFQSARCHGVPVTGAVAVSFGCPYQGEVPQKEVLRIVRAFFSNGADSIILADTTGMATPNRVDAMVKTFQDRFPGKELILHFHNNRGTAMANLLSALLSEATSFDTALGGIGGCPFVPQAAGNIPTEDAVYMLQEMGIHTGIDLESLIATARRLEVIVGDVLPGQIMKSGAGIPGPQMTAEYSL